MARTKKPLDGREVVADTWPYDGPHTSDSVIQAARAIDELTNYLANATYGGSAKTLEYGGHVYRVLGGLCGLAQLDQVLEQLATAETRLGQDPKAYDDRRDRPAAQTTAEVVEWITGARRLLSQAIGQLQAACSAASHIGYDD